METKEPKKQDGIPNNKCEREILRVVKMAIKGEAQ